MPKGPKGQKRPADVIGNAVHVMRFFVLIVALAGCATSENKIYPGFFGQNVVGNSAYVTISNVWNEMDALPLADRHCGQFQKVARFTRMEGYRAIYDCVAP